jgi:uncharacterized protein YlzI (FlbEa/FlbD family)
MVIKLTLLNGNSFLVNTNQVQTIFPKFYKGNYVTRVQFNQETMIQVRESVEEIYNQIWNEEKIETPFELITRDEDSFDFQPRPQSQRPRYNNQQEYRPRYDRNYNTQNHY